MVGFRRVFSVVLGVVAALLLSSGNAPAQVTTGTLYGVVHDTSGAILPGVNVTVTLQGTNFSRDTVTNERGEFALPALPAGSYAIKIQLEGFKTYNSQGMALGAAQTVRQTYTLEVGNLSETVTVVETAPLVQTDTQQLASIGAEVRELPISRRNLQNVVQLAPGVSVGDSAGGTGRSFRVNGVGDGGSNITVDGSSAKANPENGGFSQYGGQNQIEILSVESVAEVQVVKGILPAEYGGAVGGYVNMITRSGMNVYHGSLLENYQNQSFFARDPFLPSTTPKPSDSFNQFGGSLGGHIIRDRLMFFLTYEGYREDAGVTVQTTVPTQVTRDRILAALPFPETKIALDTLPLPNQAINADVGRYTDAKFLSRRDNTFNGKVDLNIASGRLSVTASRLRPFALQPSANVGNDQTFDNTSHRLGTQYVLTRGSWISESRFGWNLNSLERAQQGWFIPSPTEAPQTVLTDVTRRMSNFSVSGLFGTAQSEVLDLHNQSFNVDQKVSRLMGAHNMKTGFRWYRESGFKTNPQENQYTFLTLADLLSNTPSSMLVSLGQPPHTARLDQYGAFLQDDWRLNERLTFNLGVRFDYYPTVQYRATSSAPAEIVNLNSPSNLRLMDFGSPRATNNTYNASWNLGPRAGFSWKLDKEGRTVIRAGAGILSTGPLLALFQNAIANPFVSSRLTYNKTTLAAKGFGWPMYAETERDDIIKSAGGAKSLYYLIDPNFKSPSTVQTMIDAQHEIVGGVLLSGSYTHTTGKNFAMDRNFANAFDRATGLFPNPSLGTLGGWYLDSSQTMRYNAFEGNVTIPRAHGLNVNLHYTLSKGFAQQGGDLVGNFDSTPGSYGQTQDFYNPDADISPVSGEVRHRVTGTLVYEVPWLAHRTDFLGSVLGGWQVSSVLNMRSGLPLRITQPSGIGNSRPDYNGGEQVLPDWKSTDLYLNKAAYTLVPTYPLTGATVRPGTQNPSQVSGPGRRLVDVSLAKTFGLPRNGMQLQVRAEAFNVFNWLNYANPNTNITSPDFGRITASAATRTGQVGIRLTF